MFIVTYNNNNVLQEYALDSLEQSNYPKGDIEINIIDNYGDVSIDTQDIKVLKNNLRSKKSTGHLSRTWNQSIILGFGNLDQSECDAVIAVQDDTKFNKNWYKNLCTVLEKYDYVTFGAGDQLQVFTPVSVKNIGLYDERFCSLSVQAADYLLRAVRFYPDKVSINDYYHKRVYNAVDQQFNLIDKTPTGFLRGANSHKAALPYNKINIHFFKQKWGESAKLTDWCVEHIKNFNVLVPSFIYYPYFEEKINKSCLTAQKYNIWF